MAKKEVPLDHLQQYLPDHAAPAVLGYLDKYRIHLTITRERSSILGDYRHRTTNANHRISVNGTLNKWAFLITLLHEIAHLLTFEQFGNRVQAHGREWKTLYGSLLHQFLETHQFPGDIEFELRRSLQNPAASSCAEEDLLRVLRRYDEKKNNRVMVEDIQPNGLFRIRDGRVFQKGNQLRKRFKCTELATNRVFLFSPVYEVHPLTNEN